MAWRGMALGPLFLKLSKSKNSRITSCDQTPPTPGLLMSLLPFLFLKYRHPSPPTLLFCDLTCSLSLSLSRVDSTQGVSQPLFSVPSNQFESDWILFMDALNLVPAVPNLPLFFSLYLGLYLIAFFILFRNWKPQLRPEASSCIISFAHGTPAVILASRATLSDPRRYFHSHNTPFQNLALDYSIAYFLMDLCHYLVFYPNDLLFIAHHLGTFFVFVTCRYMVFHGAYAILVLLILAEITSFCQNAWTLAAARRSDLHFAAKAYQFLSPPFYALYTVARGFAGPFFVYQMLVFYLSGAADNVIPKWVWVSWTCVVVVAISVSISWVSNLWIVLYRERTKKLAEKD